MVVKARGVPVEFVAPKEGAIAFKTTIHIVKNAPNQELAFKLIGKQPPFSRRSVDFFLKHNAYDIGKAQRMLGYQPQTDLRTGMQKTIQWNR